MKSSVATDRRATAAVKIPHEIPTSAAKAANRLTAPA
jgi:hypothetical protein